MGYIDVSKNKYVNNSYAKPTYASNSVIQHCSFGQRVTSSDSFLYKIYTSDKIFSLVRFPRSKVHP